jgi:hypothetical protein
MLVQSLKFSEIKDLNELTLTENKKIIFCLFCSLESSIKKVSRLFSSKKTTFIF